jgi:glycogen synthase
MLENEETMENQLEGVEQSLADYEKRYVIGTSPGQEESWENIKKSLIEIIETSKSPYISRKFELPVILIATPEIVSLPQNMGNLANIIKTGDGGGLADISASLVTELDRQGVNVHVTLPEYQYLFSTQALIRHEAYEKLRIQIDDTSRIHLVTDDMFTGATQVYDDIYTGLDKIDLRKANAFQRGILSRTFKVLKRQHEHILVHCNDWMTGLIPAAAKIQGIKSLMTFHNIFTQYQWPKGLQKHSIDIGPFWKFLYFRRHPDIYGSYRENYVNNEVDFMTSGLFASDYINTVSPTFLECVPPIQLR